MRHVGGPEPWAYNGMDTRRREPTTSAQWDPPSMRAHGPARGGIRGERGGGGGRGGARANASSAGSRLARGLARAKAIALSSRGVRRSRVLMRLTCGVAECRGSDQARVTHGDALRTDPHSAAGNDAIREHGERNRAQQERILAPGRPRARVGGAIKCVRWASRRDRVQRLDMSVDDEFRGVDTRLQGEMAWASGG